MKMVQVKRLLVFQIKCYEYFSEVMMNVNDLLLATLHLKKAILHIRCGIYSYEKLYSRLIYINRLIHTALQANWK